MTGQAIEVVHLIIEWASLGIELLAVAIIVASVFIMLSHRGTLRYLFQLDTLAVYESYRLQLGRPLLLGLELLVAADVIRTVAIEATAKNVAVLGLFVLVRTFLGWTMSVEIEGRWPWQAPAHPVPDAAGAPPLVELPDQRSG